MRSLVLPVVIFAVCGCGDNAHSPDAPPTRDTSSAMDTRAIDARAIDAPAIDASPGLPDLTLLTSEMDGTVVVLDQTFAPGACEIVEGCVAAAGSRHLVSFATATENIGSADLDLGPVPADGVTSGYYVWSTCRMRHIVENFADYQISNGSGVVAAGHKQAFCIEDSEQVDPVVSHGFDCNHQGITSGWADIYGSSTPCQWIDVTDLPSGTYTLSVTVDAEGSLPDSNPTNNTWTTTVSF